MTSDLDHDVHHSPPWIREFTAHNSNNAFVSINVVALYAGPRYQLDRELSAQSKPYLGTIHANSAFHPSGLGNIEIQACLAAVRRGAFICVWYGNTLTDLPSLPHLAEDSRFLEPSPCHPPRD